ncbi:MAG: HEAT repeat domain-containing protein [Anaerolineae bacterium]|nr:HEAT repeat domain-containing protein [Anaerolineae bacterium]
MITDELVSKLQHSDALQRLNAAIVLGTVDEVQAIPPLIEAFKHEGEADVKQAMSWAGKRLQAARHEGYSTLEAIIQHFRIDRMLDEQNEARERQMMEQMKFRAEMEHLKRQDDNIKDMAAGSVIGGALFGLSGMMSGMAGVAPSSADFISSNLGSSGPQLGTQRIMPTRPSSSEIRLQVQRLHHDASPDKRAQAALNLARLVNNPEALPDLAHAFISDPAAAVQAAAQKAAKEIYWNAVYWDMEQNGEMAAEITRRAGNTESSAPAPKPALEDKPAASDIGAILKKAEAKREKRKRY